MHYPKHLQIALKAFDDFIDQLTSDYGVPDSMTDAELAEYMQRLREHPPFGVDFYMVMSTVSNAVTYPIGVRENLPLPGIFNDFDYLKLIHPDYLLDYLDWAKAIYVLAHKKSTLGQMQIRKNSFRLLLPILTKKGEYWWVRMATTPLQLDQNNHLLTHLNSYTLLDAFDAGAPKKTMIGGIWGEVSREIMTAWTRELRKEKTMLSVFTITETESRILELVCQHPDYRSSDIAAVLQKKTNTIERHRRNLIAKAKEAFPAFYDRQRLSIKEIAQLLKDYQYFSDPT